MKRVGRTLLAVALFAGLCIAGRTVLAQQGVPTNCRYFPDTKHWVCDQFLDFYDDRGGLEVFGFPITEAYYEPRLGLQVQYFQHARMEWHPYNPVPYQVQLGLLGDELGHRHAPIPDSLRPAANHPNRVYFPETGHTLSHEFLTYFQKHGGLDVFGYPITEIVLENDRVVQYFQRAKMVWYPDRRPGDRVQIGNLGATYVDRFGVPPDAALPRPSNLYTPPNPALQPTSLPLALRVTASVRYAVIARQGTQTVYVYVTDMQQRPLEGAQVRMVVNYAVGPQTIDLPLTNASGFTQYSFQVSSVSPAQKVTINVTASYQGVSATTPTFFTPWW